MGSSRLQAYYERSACVARVWQWPAQALALQLRRPEPLPMLVQNDRMDSCRPNRAAAGVLFYHLIRAVKAVLCGAAAAAGICPVIA